MRRREGKKRVTKKDGSTEGRRKGGGRVEKDRWKDMGDYHYHCACFFMVMHVITCLSSLQLKVLMKEFIDDVKSGGIVLGDNLETALELGEKHEAFVSKCKTVGFSLV